MASAEAERFNALLRQWALDAGADPSPEGFRACSQVMFDALGKPFPVVLTPVADAAVRAFWADEPGVTTGPNVILFLHGGGFQAGSAQTHARFAIELGRRIGARALMAEYRRMPDHIYPTQVNDCADVYQWLLASGQDPGRVIFAGESAGGNLCFTVQLEVLRRGLPAPAATYAMSPWLDFEALGQSYVYNKTADLVSGAETTCFLGGIYAGEGVDIRAPSPLYADLSGMPPTLVQVGGDEVMVSDAEQIVALLQAAGVVAEVDIVPEMQHMFQFDAGVMPEATASYDMAGQFIRRFLPN